MTPIWQDIFINDQGDHIVYELNLQNPDKIFEVINPTNGDNENAINKSNIKLLIFKNKKTSIVDYGVYLSIVSEVNTLDPSKIHYKMMGNLDGKVMYFNLDGSFANGWSYISGKLINGITPIDETTYLNIQLDKLSATKNKGNFGRDKLQRALSDDCSGKITDYGVACVGVDGYMTCTIYEKGTSYFNACGSGGGSTGGGVGGGGYEPSSGGGGTAPVFDCAGVRDGKAINSPCGCIGGNTGMTSCAQKDIIDSLVGYPCAQDLVKKIPNLKNSIAALIKTTFASGSDIDLKFTVDAALKGTSTDGKFIGFAGAANGSYGTYTIGINPDVLNSATKEFILVTLYHESLHAYFDHMKRILTPTEFTNRFGNLSSNGGRTLFTEVNGHFEMGANNFLLGMRDGIRAFNLSYDIDRAYALAKGGVVILSLNDKSVNDQERDTTNPGYTGTKCP